MAKRNVFTPKSTSISAPNIGSGGGSGIGTLLGYMIAQQKGQGLQGQLGNDTTVTGGTDPVTGAKFQTPESISKRKYGKEDIQIMGASDTFTRSRDYIIEKMDEDPEKFSEAFKKANVAIPGLTWGKQARGNLFGVPTTVGSELAINLQRELDNMSDLLLRLRSGAQINEQEFQRLRGLLPTYKDITVPLSEDGSTTFPTIRKSLNDFERDLSIAKKRAIEGGYFNEDLWVDNKNEQASSSDNQVDNKQSRIDAIKQRYRQRNP